MNLGQSKRFDLGGEALQPVTTFGVSRPLLGREDEVTGKGVGPDSPGPERTEQQLVKSESRPGT